MIINRFLVLLILSGLFLTILDLFLILFVLDLVLAPALGGIIEQLGIIHIGLVICLGRIIFLARSKKRKKWKPGKYGLTAAAI